MSFSVSYLYRLRDEMSPVLRKISGESHKMAKDVQSHAQRISQGMERTARGMKSVGAQMTVAGGAITAPLALATREAMRFRKGVAEIATLMPDKTLQEVRDEFDDVFLGIAKSYGKSTADVVSASYRAVSTGVEQTKDAVKDFLEISSQASIGGVTDIETAVGAISSTMNAYKDMNLEAKDVANAFFSAVRQGDTTFDELAKHMYKVTTPASQLKIDLHEVASAVAVMTARGAPTRIALTRVQGIMDELGTTGSKASDIFKKMAGISFREFTASGGELGDALEMLNQYAGKYNRTMKDVFSSSVAGEGALVLTGTGAVDLKKAFAESKKDVDALSNAFKKMALDESFQFDKAKQNIQTTAIAIGTLILPAVTKLFKKIESGLGIMQDWIKENPKLAQTILLITAGIGAFLTVGGTSLMMLGMMMSGVVALGKAFIGIKIALGVMKTAFIKTTVFLLTNPIGWLVLGIAGIVASIYLVWKHWEKVKTWIGSAVNWIIEFFNRWKKIIAVIAVVAFPTLLPFIALALLIRKHWSSVVYVFTWLWEKIKIIGAYWKEFFTPIVEYWKDAFCGAIESVVDGIKWLWDWIMKIPKGLDWIEGKLGKLFKWLKLDKAFGIDINPPAPEMLESLNKIQQSQINPQEFFGMNDIFREKSPGDLTVKSSIPEIDASKQSVDVNLNSDVGGILTIEIDNKGRAKQVGTKQNGNLGFQVQ